MPPFLIEPKLFSSGTTELYQAAVTEGGLAAYYRDLDAEVEAEYEADYPLADCPHCGISIPNDMETCPRCEQPTNFPGPTCLP